MPNLLRLWTGPLPKEELFPDRKINLFLHWFIHPVKRHIAKYYLLILQKFFGLKVIAVTGSSGKTTTCRLLNSILSQISPTILTADSVTSTYNLPTTILHCSPATRFLILEMGVEYPGDMDFYCWLAKPDIGVVLNVSSVHSSFLGSLENIKREKYKLLKYSRVGLASSDFPRIISSHITPDLKTEVLMIINHNSYLINLNLLGTHFSQNTAAVAAIATHLGITPSQVKSGLESVTPPPHRMNLIRLSNGSIILDDSYNANPLSTSQSLIVLSQISSIQHLRSIFIFGQMNELGQYEKSEHKKIGLLVKKLGIKDFYCLGPATKFAIQSAGFGRYFENLDSISKFLIKFCPINSKSLPAGRQVCILIKGSHSWHLEELVSSLLPRFPSSNY